MVNVWEKNQKSKVQKIKSSSPKKKKKKKKKIPGLGCELMTDPAEKIIGKGQKLV